MVRCPVEDCEYGEASTTVDALRSHVNAKADHPDWSDVEELLVEQAGDGGDDQPVGATSSATTGGSTDPDGGDDQPVGATSSATTGGSTDPDGADDQPVGATSSATTGGSTDPDDGDDQSVGARSSATTGGSTDSDGGDDQPGDPDTDMVSDTELERQRQQATDQEQQSDGQSTGGDRTGISLPIDSTTAVVVLALVVTGLVLYAYVGTSEDPADPGPEDNVGEDPDPADMEAGLVPEGTHA